MGLRGQEGRTGGKGFVVPFISKTALEDMRNSAKDCGVREGYSKGWLSGNSYGFEDGVQRERNARRAEERKAEAGKESFASKVAGFTTYSTGYATGGIVTPKPHYLDALDLVLDAFKLREEYPNFTDERGLGDDGYPVMRNGAQRFYNDLKAAKEFRSAKEAADRIARVA